MHSGKRFGACEFAVWTKRSILWLTILSAIAPKKNIVL